MKNTRRKQRTVESPYLVFRAQNEDWEWRVLKAYQADDEAPFARWYCATRSPGTFGRWEYGDAYCADVKRHGIDVTKEILVAEKLAEKR